MSVSTAEQISQQISLVVPVYNNEGGVPALVEAVSALHDELGAFEAVFVVDGSPDNSHAALQKALAGARFPAQLIALSRNFGSFAAIRCGLEAGEGPLYAVMAADLQEPPELVKGFADALRADTCDVAMGVRSARADPALSRLSSRLFWWTYRTFVQPSMPVGGVDVFGCNRAVRDAILACGESNSSLVGLLCWVGFRRELVPYERRARAEGRSGWTLGRRLRYMLDSMLAFSDLAIRLLLVIGLVGIAVSLTAAAVVLVAWATGSIPVPGYTPIMLAVSFGTSAVLTAQGIVGAYVWRTFENSKRRPGYIERTRAVYRKG